MTPGTELHRVGGGMNSVLYFQGFEADIIKSMEDMRLHGIPFVTCEADSESMVNKGIWSSSRETLANWSLYASDHPNWVNLYDSDFYCYVRERDVEVAMIISRVRTKVISRETKRDNTGV